MLSLVDWLVVGGAMGLTAVLCVALELRRTRQNARRASALRAQAAPSRRQSRPPVTSELTRSELTRSEVARESSPARGPMVLETRTTPLAGMPQALAVPAHPHECIAGDEDWTDPPVALGQPAHCTPHPHVEPLMSIQRHRSESQAHPAASVARGKARSTGTPSSASLAKERLRSLGLGQGRGVPLETIG